MQRFFKMKFKNDTDNYGFITKFLHWGIAIVFFILFFFGKYIHNLEITRENIPLFGIHKSLGLLIFILIIMRIIWHIISPTPPIENPSNSLWQKKIAKLTHKILYILMISTPLFGWISSSATGYEIQFFSLFNIPLIAPESEHIKSLFFKLHAASAMLLLLLAIGHAIIALYHHFIKRDKTLRRMLPSKLIFYFLKR